MKSYHVTVTETVTTTYLVPVEAMNTEEAEKTAIDILVNDEEMREQCEVKSAQVEPEKAVAVPAVG